MSEHKVTITSVTIIHVINYHDQNAIQVQKYKNIIGLAIQCHNLTLILQSRPSSISLSRYTGNNTINIVTVTVLLKQNRHGVPVR